MSAPASFQEYLARFHANTQASGFGLDTTSHIPCPFCAAADFLVARLLDFEDAMKRETTCRECGRSGKNLFTYTATAKSFEFVQTSGDDPPSWMTPAPRRVDPEEAR